MKRVQHTMIRTHLVLSMFIVYEASSATRLRIGLFYRDLGARWLTTRSLQDIRTGDEEIRIVNQKRKEMRRRSPASCPRFVSRRTGAPRAVAENECTVARPRPPPIPYTLFDRIRRSNTTHTRIRKRQRNADGTSRPHRTEVAQISARNRVNPPDRTRGKAAHTHTRN